MTPEQRVAEVEELVDERLAAAEPHDHRWDHLRRVLADAGDDPDVAWAAIAPLLAVMLAGAQVTPLTPLNWWEGALDRLQEFFAGTLWPSPRPIEERFAELRHSIAAEVDRHTRTEVFRAANLDAATRADAAGNELVWHVEPGACEDCTPFDSSTVVPGADLPPVHPNCRCVVLADDATS